MESPVIARKSLCGTGNPHADNSLQEKVLALFLSLPKISWSGQRNITVGCCSRTMDGMLWEIAGISHRCDITITHSRELILVYTWTLIGKCHHVIYWMDNILLTGFLHLKAIALDYNPEVAHRHTWWSTETSLKLPFHTCQMSIKAKSLPLL